MKPTRPSDRFDRAPDSAPSSWRTARLVAAAAVLLIFGRSASASDGEVTLSTRVVDSAGQSVVGARVRVLTLTDDALALDLGRLSRKNNETREVVFAGATRLATDAAGEFVTPGPVPSGTCYVLTVEGPGLLPAISEWSRASARGNVRLPDVVLRRLLQVQGQVIDRAGRPVEGARVFQSGDGPEPTESQTDARGRFRVPGVPEGPAFLFAEKPGWRFHGQRIDAGTGEVEIVLVSAGDPNPPTLRTLPPPRVKLSEKERKRIARELLQPALDRWLAGTPGRSTPLPEALSHRRGQWSVEGHFLIAVARVAPDVAIEHRDLPPTPQSRYVLLALAAAEISRRDPREGLAILRSIDDPALRANALTYDGVAESADLRLVPFADASLSLREDSSTVSR